MWTLHVEDFAGIEKADIEVSPLTLFVGDNNSGKSYLLSLIYGLMCADDVLSDLCEDSAEYRACAEWLEKALEQGKQSESDDEEIPFDDYAYAIFESLFNHILECNRDSILKSIFKQDISIGKFSVTFQRRTDEMLSVYNAVMVNFPFAVYPPYIFNEKADRQQVIYELLRLLLQALIKQGDPDEQICFLPTSRTGFLLTYPALAKDAFVRAYGPNKRRKVDLSLIKPFTDFLGNLTTVNVDDISETYQPIIGFMERHIIHGKILVSNDLPLPEFYYLPENMETSLPMYLSSDVVKEIAPLILILQYKVVDALFIEEPEMSLHPKLQQMMARTLIKLVNAGTPVFAATHSDTILQHVNNMVKLNNLPEARKRTLAERFGFDPDDPISADKISVYQFDGQDNGKTAVRALSHGDYGFGVPTFYDPLEKIMEQTQATEPDAEEYED